MKTSCRSQQYKLTKVCVQSTRDFCPNLARFWYSRHTICNRDPQHHISRQSTQWEPGGHMRIDERTDRPEKLIGLLWDYAYVPKIVVICHCDYFTVKYVITILPELLLVVKLNFSCNKKTRNVEMLQCLLSVRTELCAADHVTKVVL
jgi:hypothetical protein